MRHNLAFCQVFHSFSRKLTAHTTNFTPTLLIVWQGSPLRKLGSFFSRITLPRRVSRPYLIDRSRCWRSSMKWISTGSFSYHVNGAWSPKRIISWGTTSVGLTKTITCLVRFIFLALWYRKYRSGRGEYTMFHLGNINGNILFHLWLAFALLRFSLSVAFEIDLGLRLLYNTQFQAVLYNFFYVNPRPLLTAYK